MGIDSKLIGLRKFTNQWTRIGQEQLLKTFSFHGQISDDREAFLIPGYYITERGERRERERRERGQLPNSIIGANELIRTICTL